MKKNTGLLLLLFSTILISCNRIKTIQENTAALPWNKIEEKARNTTLTMMMYQGDKKGNAYMRDYVAKELKQQYGITLNLVAGQGKDIVGSIMSQKEAGKDNGEIDLCWINGETFYQLRQINGLYGPYTDKLPNSRYIDYNDPIIKYDFQQEIGGYETPWGKAFFSIICDSAKVKMPPVSMQDFEAYWKKNPGKFTLALDFLGMTLLKSWLVELAGGINALDGKFDEVKYEKYSSQLWDFINRNKNNFWKKGETFPASSVTISQMYGNGEVNFTFAFGVAEIDRKVAEGSFPVTSRGFIPKAGSIQNTSYIGIPYNSANKAGAMVVCNYLISPKAQIDRSNITIWGGAPVFDYTKLEKRWQDAYDSLPKLKYGLRESEVKARSIKETESRYMIKVAEDFRKKVIETN
jgi:putative spermidine/putrescine transport system substrate-binding protein